MRKNKRKSHRRCQFLPQGERLESRLALAVQFSGGILTCTGDDNPNSFFLALDSNGTDILVNGSKVFDNGTPARIDNTTRIEMFGLGGNDFLSVGEAFEIEAHLFGGDGNDTLVGGRGNDVLDGGSNTPGGRDVLIQTADVDFVLTNGTLFGVGVDTLSGIEEVHLTGGPSDNLIDASNFTAGPVVLSGLGGNDTLRGGGAGDHLSGGDGDDKLFGNGGNDQMFGGEGHDELHGGTGNDHLSGGAGNDKLFGDEDGNPLNLPGTCNDVLLGGEGNDELHGSDGDDQLSGGEGHDLLFGGPGNDQLAGDDGNDELHGGEGNDNLIGGEGNDQLFGEGGNDLLQGGPGDDTLDGGEGLFDALSINAFDDVTGQTFHLTDTTVSHDTEGTDTILGGIETVNLNAGSGDDVFIIEGFFRRVNVTGGDGVDLIVVSLDLPEIELVGSNSFGLPRINYADPATNRTGSILSGGRFIERFQVLLGPGDNRVDLSQWSGELEELSGGGGMNTIAVTKDADMTVTDGQITFSTGGNVQFDNFNVVALTGGPGNNRIDASAFSGLALLSGAGGNDFILGTQGDDVIFGGDGNDTLIGNGGNDTLFGGDGNDKLEGGAGEDQLFGGPGNDTLNGGADDDQLSGGTGKNNLDGGPGTDTIFAEGDVAAFTLTAKKLTGPGVDMHKNIEQAELVGGPGRNVFTFDNFNHAGQNRVVGGGGDDRIVVKSNSPVFMVTPSIQGQVVWGLNADRLALLDALGSVQDLVLIGGSGANTFLFEDRAPVLHNLKLTIDGGGGKDTFLYSRQDSSAASAVEYVLSAAQLAASNRAFPIALTKVERVELEGMAGLHNTFDVSAWNKEAKITGVSPEGVSSADQSVLISSADRNFTLTDKLLTRSDKARIEYANLSQVELTGGGKKNSLTVNATLAEGIKYPDVSFDGGAGDDQIVLNIQSGANGTTTSLGPGSLTNEDQISFGLSAHGALPATIKSVAVERIVLNGGAGADVFEVRSDFTPKISVNGAGDIDRFDLIVMDSLNVTAANKLVSHSDGKKYALNLIEELHVTIGSGFTSRVDVSAWSLEGQIIGTGANVTLVATNNLPLMRLDEFTLTRNGKQIIHANVLEAELTGGSGKNVIDATGFNGTAILKGLGGDDTLIGGNGNDVLDGGKGKDTLDGGPGVDTVVNPEPGDTLLNIP